MKKVQQSILRRINRWIVRLISLLGVGSFVSCFSEMYGIPPIDDLPVMYGTPSAEFGISGRVEDVMSKGIEGIEVGIAFDGYHHACGVTNADGSFLIEGTGFPDKHIWVYAKDVDSTANGVFKTDSVMISPQYVEDPHNAWKSIAHEEGVIIRLEEEINE